MKTESHLASVTSPPGHGTGSAPEGILLRPSPKLADFIAAAARAGLDLQEATRLAVERLLLLNDAPAIGFDSEIARRRLTVAARGARPDLNLTAVEAARVRALSLPRRIQPMVLAAPTAVPVPDRILPRVCTVSNLCFEARFVSEMVSWEVAAILAGRTMGEWGLRILAAA